MKYALPAAIIGTLALFVVADVTGLTSYGMFYLVVTLGLASIHVVLTTHVFKAAKRNAEELYLHIQPWAWALITLVFGLLGLLVYWLVNDSSFARK